MSQFRQNPITKNWILIAPNRSKRPEQFAGRPVINSATPEISESCFFCPGANESKNIEIARFPDNKNWQLRLIRNKFEALTHQPNASRKDFYISRSGIGDHEVLITRKHNEPVALQSIHTVELTLHVFREHYLDLMRHPELCYVQIFHNHGRDAGASLIHPHYQIMATPLVPPGIQNEMLGTYHYFQQNGHCVHCAIIDEEQKMRERLIYETEDFIVLAPYASRSPFETWILPKKHAANFETITDKEITQLAYVLKITLGQLYTKLADPPLNFYLHTMPFAHARHTAHQKQSYHWHWTIFPRIAIWAGFEYATGIPINPMPPEDATKFLKS